MGYCILAETGATVSVQFLNHQQETRVERGVVKRIRDSASFRRSCGPECAPSFADAALVAKTFVTGGFSKRSQGEICEMRFRGAWEEGGVSSE